MLGRPECKLGVVGEGEGRIQEEIKVELGAEAGK